MVKMMIEIEDDKQMPGAEFDLICYLIHLNNIFCKIFTQEVEGVLRCSISNLKDKEAANYGYNESKLI